jgi:hypothetical protein
LGPEFLQKKSKYSFEILPSQTLIVFSDPKKLIGDAVAIKARRHFGGLSSKWASLRRGLG